MSESVTLKTPGQSARARQAALEDLRKTIAQAKDERHVVNAPAEARRIAARHPEAALSYEEIAQALVELAGSTGVAMRLSSK